MEEKEYLIYISGSTVITEKDVKRALATGIKEPVYNLKGLSVSIQENIKNPGTLSDIVPASHSTPAPESPQQ